MDTTKLALDNLIYEVVTGSHAYGTNIETSDEDARGLFILPKDLAMSPFFQLGEASVLGQDVKYFELAKFMKLLLTNNPNIIELLWIPEDLVLFKHPVMDILLKNRDAFLSTKVRHTFAGYAFAQMKRLKGHEKWINNPQPVEAPALRKFIHLISNKGIHTPYGGVHPYILSEATATKINDTTFCLWNDETNQLKKGFLTSDSQTTPSYIDIDFEKMKKINPQFLGVAMISMAEYKEQLKKHEQYWTWKKNRNEARAELEAKAGYDSKHAMHLTRILRMGVEILKGEGVKVRRPDAQELLEIRNGKWTLEQVISHAEELEKELEGLYKTSKLPHDPDAAMGEKVYLEMCNYWWDTKIK